MPTYYFFHKNNNVVNGIPTLKKIECSFERWADVRTKIEEMLGICRLVQVGKKFEHASLFGCVVGNRLCYHDWSALYLKSTLLPLLENGSLLIDGDTIIIAVVPYRSVLYYQDIWHRYWLFSLLKNYYASKGYLQDFEKEIRRYDLRLLVCRVIAIAKQKANPTINLKQKNKILKDAFEHAVKKFEPTTKEKAILFDFGASFKPAFGIGLHEKMSNELRNVNIDFNRNTKFLTRLIKDAGGDLEFGESIAKRLGIESPQLVQLVRDVLHNYQPQYVAKEKPTEEFLLNEEFDKDFEEEESDDEAPNSKRRKINDESLEVWMVEQEQLAKKKAEQNQNPETANPQTMQEEMQLIEKVITSAAENQGQQPIFSMQVYCMCCDVLGHHTNSCPRLEFLEQIRQSCCISGPIPWSIFYAPENGICPVPKSLLSRFVTQYFPSKAGEINRKVAKHILADEFALPPVPYYTNTRWLIDTT